MRRSLTILVVLLLAYKPIPAKAVAPPERILSQPTEPRTQQFLQRIIEAGRL